MQFKKSQSINNFQFLLHFITCLCLSGCKVSEGLRSEDLPLSHLNSIENNYEPAISHSGIHILTPDKTAIGLLTAGSCNPFSSSHNWIVPIQTPLETLSVPIHIPLTSLEPFLSIQVEDALIKLDIREEYPADEVNKFCRFVEGQYEIKASINHPIIKYLAHIFKSAIPDCMVEFEDRVGLTCKIKNANILESKEKLLSISKKMAVKWQRIPYLLQRRISFTRQLISAIEHNNQLLNQNSVCQIMRSSKPIEIPLALTDTQWQEMICKAKSTSELKGSISLLLGKATEEILHLYNIGEKTNRSGYLRFKIPHSQLKTRNLSVQIKPLPEAMTQLNAARLMTLKKNDSQSLHIDGNTCWSPIFNQHSLNIAKKLGLTNTSTQLHCVVNPHTHATRQEALGESYILNSLLGETSFRVSNGKSKYLRLPLGKYQYTIKQVPLNLIDLNNKNALQSKGSFSWKKRPRPTIKTFDPVTR